MAETTGIAWTRSTFNPWIGCTKVSPGCDHCYAEVSRPALGMGIKWGPGMPRHRTSGHLWKQPLKWEREAAVEQQLDLAWVDGPADHPGFWPVFCASLADVFDNEVPPKWREDLWQVIWTTPHLTWQLLTKRIGNVERMLPSAFGVTTWPWPNVWIGASIVNQEEADRDIPKLLAVPAAKRFVSYEPALGPIDLTNFVWATPGGEIVGNVGRPEPQLHWVIVGGESKQGKHDARPFDIEWARSTVRQCKAAGVAVFVKQLGSEPYDSGCTHLPVDALFIKDRAGADPAEWPEDLRVQQFPV